MADLNELLNSHVPEIQDMTKHALAYKLLLDSGKLSVDEYDELISDLTNLDNIKSEMMELKIYKLIEDAITTIQNLRALSL